MFCLVDLRRSMSWLLKKAFLPFLTPRKAAKRGARMARMDSWAWREPPAARMFTSARVMRFLRAWMWVNPWALAAEEEEEEAGPEEEEAAWAGAEWEEAGSGAAEEEEE